MPKNDNDPSAGFVDIPFRKFANAVNHAAAWLDATLGLRSSSSSGGGGGGKGTLEVFAYQGANDCRPAILAAAAAKTGRQILLPFPLAPPAAKIHLLDASGCEAFLFTSAWETAVDGLLAERPKVKRAVAPDLSEWVTDVPAAEYPYDRTWSEAKDEPWIIFHTSGTTGLPKPVVYTQRMMGSIALAEKAANLAAIPGASTSMSLFRNSRMHSSIPLNHLVGLTGALSAPILLGTVMVLGPANRPPSAATVDMMMAQRNIDGLASTPLIIRDLCRDETSLSRMRNLKYISWTGAPLDPESDELLNKHTQLSPSMGTTEYNPYWTYCCKEPGDWPYYWFVEGQGIEFEPVLVSKGEQLYELVFRKSASSVWQQIFLLFPHLETYHTSDVFRKHPTKSHLWQYAGRTDDVVKLANGDAVRVSSIETAIEKSLLVRSALVGGTGKPRLFLLVELVEGVERESATSGVWDFVRAVNRDSPAYASIDEGNIVLGEPSRPFLRSVKGSVLRKETMELYQDEIEKMEFRSQ